MKDILAEERARPAPVDRRSVSPGRMNREGDLCTHTILGLGDQPKEVDKSRRPLTHLMHGQRWSILPNLSEGTVPGPRD